MGWINRDVRVVLINTANGRPFLRGNVPLGDLPDSFRHDTTIYLRGRDWQVVDADPPLKRTFAKTRELTLHVEKPQKFDAATLLY